MDLEYSKEIISCAVEKLANSKKQLSENELVRGIIHLLKKKLGKDDTRHSAKGRFRKNSFKYIIETNDWKTSISQLENKKYVLAKDYDIHAENLNIDSEWKWQDANKELAQKKLLNTLYKIHNYKFEFLVRDVVKKSFPDVSFEVTVATGDMGIDIWGVRNDPVHKDRKEAVYIQVKKYKGSVGRPDADKFIGAIREIANDKSKNFSKFVGLFITTGTYPKTFNDKLSRSSETGITFSCWDGDELTERMISLGMGVKYSIDIDFWNEIDSNIIPKNKKQL
jgi:restriction endonuclease Mrr